MAHCIVPAAEALLDKAVPVLDKGFVLARMDGSRKAIWFCWRPWAADSPGVPP